MEDPLARTTIRCHPRATHTRRECVTLPDLRVVSQEAKYKGLHDHSRLMNPAPPSQPEATTWAI